MTDMKRGFEFSEILGSSPAIRRALQLAERFARSDISILLVGETGTGKELFAQAIQRWSGRSGQLVGINCGALPRDLVEGELFGHRRGAFTGAIADRRGLFSAAAGGTLFLDELTSLPLEAQVKLLRVLDSGEVRRLGDSQVRRVDFGVVAAAQPEIESHVERRTFRLDLYQRLAGVVIHLPSLNQRPEDIGLLAHSFALQKQRAIGPDAVDALRQFSWPGNVRELRAVVDRAACLATDVVIGRTAVLEAISLGSSSQASERRGVVSAGTTSGGETLEALCERCQWRADIIQSALSISRATLFRRLRESGLSLRSRHAYRRGVNSRVVMA